MDKKILIIEDDLDLVKLLALKLKSSGYAVTIAQDPIQGIAQSRKSNPDLIILDLMMPAGGGKLFIENIARSIHTFLIPIIVTSATKDEVLIQFVLDRGLKYVQKPYDADELVSLISGILK